MRAMINKHIRIWGLGVGVLISKYRPSWEVKIMFGPITVTFFEYSHD